MWIKICGLDGPAAVEAAFSAGAQALGFVLAESRRRVSPEEIRAWSEGVPTERIGVFVGQGADLVLDLADRAGLTGLQVYDPLLAAELRARRPDLRILQAFALAPGDPDPPPGAEAVLLDRRHGGQVGGTGLVGDWERARRVALLRPVILAGGLTPENVRLALETVRPYGVDVSSGVEEAGRKSPERIFRFVEEVRRWQDERTG